MLSIVLDGMIVFALSGAIAVVSWLLNSSYGIYNLILFTFSIVGMLALVELARGNCPACADTAFAVLDIIIVGQLVVLGYTYRHRNDPDLDYGEP